MISGLPIKLSSHSELSFRFDALTSISFSSSRVGSFIVTITFKCSFGHNLILWKCNFLLFTSASLIVIISSITGLTCKLSSYFQLSLSFDGFSSDSLRIDVIVEVRWSALEFTFGKNFIIGVDNFICFQALVHISGIWICVVRLVVVYRLLGHDEIFVDEIVFADLSAGCLVSLGLCACQWLRIGLNGLHLSGNSITL